MKKKLIQIILVITMFLGVGATTSVKVEAAEPKIDAKAALAVDLETGRILLKQNADESLPIASITKMVTLYLVQDAIKSGQIKQDDTIKVPADIAKFSQDPALSNVPLTAGESYTVEELYESGWIYSSNAAAMLLADRVAGSQAEFVKMMQQQLEKWDINDAQIVNVSGLNNENIPAKLRVKGTDAKAENKMSAVDLAVVARHLLKKYPEILNITKIAEKVFDKGGVDEFTMHSFNRMLPNQVDSYADLTVDGLKTGTTDAAGESFVGTTKEDGYRILTVVMDAGGAKDDKGKRFKVTAQVMRHVYANWTKKTVYEKGDTSIVKPVKLKYGKEKSVKLESKQPVVVWTHNDTTDKTKIVLNKTKVNSAKKGEVFGTIKVQDDGLGYLPGLSGDAQLVATKNVKEKNIFEKLAQGIGEFFGNLF